MPPPTPELQQAITHLHQAIATEQDPKHMSILGTCLQKMMQVQAELMQGGGGNGGPPQGAGAQMAEMAGGGSPPAGPLTAADPRAFIGG